jgi:hypothetical protein
MTRAARHAAFAVAVMFAVLLGGCAATTATPSSPRPSPTFSADPTYSFSMSCQNAALKTSYRYASYRELWSTTDPVVNCNADEPTGSNFSPEQLAALDAVGYDHTTQALGFLYARCADLATTDPVDGYWSSAYAALSLCPDHPDAATIVARADAGMAAENTAAALAAEEAALAQQTVDQRNAEIAAGTRITSGIYRVGEAVQPGTFVSEGQFANCYWERRDAAGSIIENGFAVSALRVEVTIDPSDFSFYSERCGEWMKS